MLYFCIKGQRPILRRRAIRSVLADRDIQPGEPEQRDHLVTPRSEQEVDALNHGTPIHHKRGWTTPEAELVQEP